MDEIVIDSFMIKRSHNQPNERYLKSEESGSISIKARNQQKYIYRRKIKRLHLEQFTCVILILKGIISTT